MSTITCQLDDVGDDVVDDVIRSDVIRTSLAGHRRTTVIDRFYTTTAQQSAVDLHARISRA